MGKRSNKSSPKKERSRKRTGITPTPAATAPVSAEPGDALWSEVFAARKSHDPPSRRPSRSQPAAPAPVRCSPPADLEDAFFDQGVSLSRAAVIDDADTFRDLDVAQERRHPTASRWWATRALVGTVMAAAMTLLALGPGKATLVARASDVSVRATTTESSTTARVKAEPPNRNKAASSKPAPRDRRR